MPKYSSNSISIDNLKWPVLIEKPHMNCGFNARFMGMVFYNEVVKYSLFTEDQLTIVNILRNNEQLHFVWSFGMLLELLMGNN